jgi:hypothetical protein
MSKTETEVTFEVEGREPVTMTTTEFDRAAKKIIDRALPGISAFPELDFPDLFYQWRSLREDRTAMGKKITAFEKEMIARLEALPDREVIVDGYRVSLQEQREVLLDVPVVVESLLGEETGEVLAAIIHEMTGAQANDLAESFPASADAIEKAQYTVGTGAVRIRVRKQKKGR